MRGLRALGYSYQAQAHHVGAGTWLRMNCGVFRLAGWIPDIHDDLARWTLWSRSRGVVSHETALAVHGIGEFESPRVHLTVPAGFTMRDDAVVVHRAELPPTDVIERIGFQVTNPVRSIVDIAATAPDGPSMAAKAWGVMVGNSAASPVSTRLIVEGLRLVRGASWSSDRPSVVRRLRSRVRTTFSISFSSVIARSPFLQI